MTGIATRLRGGLRRLARQRRGSMLVESAMMLSVLATLTLGGLEVARFAMLHQKMERVASSIGDMVAQAETLTETDINNIMAAAEHIASPYELSLNGRVMVSAVSAHNGNPPTMNWQRSGAGSNPGASHVGTPGNAPTLPPGLTVANGDTVIVAEVIYRYTPWLFPELIGATDVYQSAYFRPRFGALTQIN